MLTVEQLSKVLVASAQFYKISYTCEVKDMTTIIDPNNTIKSEEESENWRQTLLEKYQLKTLITSVD